MNLNEINDLISIRQYLYQAVNNMALNKEIVKFYQKSIILIDNKISSLIQSDAFKDYIDYESASKAVQEARNITDIRFGMKPIQK